MQQQDCGDQFKEEEVSETYICANWEMHTKVKMGSLAKREHLKDLGVDGRIGRML
jgi:hypothetical protein